MQVPGFPIQLCDSLSSMSVNWTSYSLFPSSNIQSLRAKSSKIIKFSTFHFYFYHNLHIHQKIKTNPACVIQTITTSVQKIWSNYFLKITFNILYWKPTYLHIKSSLIKQNSKQLEELQIQNMPQRYSYTDSRFWLYFRKKNYCFTERFKCQISDFKRRFEQFVNKLTWIWHRNIKKSKESSSMQIFI